MTTRRFHMNDLRSKRFMRVLGDVLIPHTGGLRVTTRTVNPDATETLYTLTNFTGSDEDYTVKIPVRKKANYMDVIVSTTANRPTVRALSVEAAGKSETATETRTRE